MDVTVGDGGVCKKKLTITIPREDVDKKLDERFTELQREAQVPGFRPGHAPRRLVEKRFREAVTEEVRTALAAESFQKALEEQKLDVIGEPDLGPDAIQMPDDGPMTLTVELEVRPEFEVPDYAGIPIDVERKPVDEKDVEHAIEHAREEHAPLELVPEGKGAKKKDYVAADLVIRAGEEKVVDRQDARFQVDEIVVEGIPLADVPKILKGAKVGETKTAAVKIPDDAAREDLRGKEAEVRITVRELRRPVDLDDEGLLKAVGYESMDALKGSIRRQLEGQADLDYRRRQEEAVRAWLLEHAPMELPEDLAKRHADRLLGRTLVNLQYRGVPVGEIEKRLDEIRSASAAQSARDLKLTFILDRIASKEKVEVTDAEVDARVRFIAAQYGRRADRVREDMQAKGTLESLRGQIQEDKVIRMLLDKAKVAGEPEKPAPPAADSQNTHGASEPQAKPDAPETT